MGRGLQQPDKREQDPDWVWTGPNWPRTNQIHQNRPTEQDKLNITVILIIHLIKLVCKINSTADFLLTLNHIQKFNNLR